MAALSLLGRDQIEAALAEVDRSDLAEAVSSRPLPAWEQSPRGHTTALTLDSQHDGDPTVLVVALTPLIGLDEAADLAAATRHSQHGAYWPGWDLDPEEGR